MLESPTQLELELMAHPKELDHTVRKIEVLELLQGRTWMGVDKTIAILVKFRSVTFAILFHAANLHTDLKIYTESYIKRVHGSSL